MSTGSSLLSAGLIIPGCLALYWASLVWMKVPEPYLDEYFHINQVRAYCDGNWTQWDPKITTPPGLYVVTLPIVRLIAHLWSSELDSNSYRIVNLIASLNLIRAAYVSIIEITRFKSHDGTELAPTESDRRPNYSHAELLHVLVNIYLFPVLFFFYGLYYTDVYSAFTVLFAYRCHLEHKPVGVMGAGLISLFMRQTNIFWVAVFLGGLEVCRTIPKGRAHFEFPCQPTIGDVVSGSWKYGRAYDPLIREAGVEDYAKVIVSLIVAASRRRRLVVHLLFPQFLLLSAFALFVWWNGGVVLGDKDNHIASLHLAQMLYIWPYFMFFSFPILYSSILNAVINQKLIPAALRSGSTKHQLPSLIVAIPTMGIMLAIVHYNTIVHPFSLADNRHYMFYVFRLLLRHPYIKYLAVPIYFICAWAVLTSLGGLPNQQHRHDAEAKVNDEKQESPSVKAKVDNQKENRSKANAKAKTKLNGGRQQVLLSTAPSSPPPLEAGTRASFLLVWLLATTLSLVTAPLVEPRYFIVPWLIWRMHVVGPRPVEDEGEPEHAHTTYLNTVKQFLKMIFLANHDNRLWLETAWFVLINAVTGYIFLYWVFEWPQEPGVVQRFMW